MQQGALNQHRKDIDGLRAVAVIPVVLYHLGLVFPGGFVGVDVFFVISGYLITGIILRELESERFSILKFYERRVRRILPAFSCVLLAVLGAAWFLYLPDEMEQLGKHLTSVAACVSNFWLKDKASDYWSPRAEEYPLLHTWSLAVEEQFYVIMPLLLIVLHRFQRKQLGLWMLAALVVSLVYGIRTSYVDVASAFYLLPSRSWELLLGAVLAFYVRKGAAKATEGSVGGLDQLVGFVGLGLIVGSYFWIGKETVFPGYAALFPTLGTVCVIWSNRSGQTVIGRVLGWAPLQFVGLISYSLYLWHWPLIVFARAYRYPRELLVGDYVWVLVLSVVLAAVSWYFVEQPFRKRSRTVLGSWMVNAVGAAVLVFFVGLSLVMRKLDGYPKRFEARTSDAVYAMVLSDVKDKQGSNRFQAKPRFMEGGLQHEVSAERPPEVVVIGDSHGAMLAPAIHAVAREAGLAAAYFTQDGHNVIVESPDVVFEAIEADLETWQPKVIFMIMRWDGAFEESGAAPLNERSLDFVRMLGQNCEQLYVTLQVPIISEVNHRAAKLLFNEARRNGGVLPEIGESSTTRETNVALRAFLDSLAIENLKVLDVSAPFLQAEQVIYHDAGRLYYRDNDHLNVRGANLLKPMLAEVLGGKE